MTRKSTLAAKMARVFAAALGMLLCLGAHATPATDYAYVAVGSVAAQPRGLAAGSTARARALAPQYRPAGGTPDFSAPVDASQSGSLPRLDYVFDRDLQLSSDRSRQNEREVLLRNSDALVRARLRLTLGREWLFVYGDMGPADSALRWQGLLGIRVGHGAKLLGGWRHVTYYFSPGRDFNALDFEGPFLGAQRSW